MRRTWLVMTAAVVLIVGAGIGIALATTPRGDQSAGQVTGGAGTSSPVDAGAAPSSEPSIGDGPVDPSTPPSTPDTGRHEEGGSSTLTPETALPPVEPVPQILPGPAPANADAEGKLAKDFPESVPVAPKSTVVTSSLSSEGARVQATLTAHSELSETALLNYYRAEFAKFGLLDVPAPSAGGSTALQFTREDDSITLVATPAAAGVEYVVFATLTARG